VARPDSSRKDAEREAAAASRDPDSPPPRRLPSIIGSTVVMKGELVVGEDLVIEGTFDGTIVGRGHGRDKVTIRRTAQLTGEISASEVRVDDGSNLENAVLSGRISRTNR
jgi:cytoskeletal protein CcmA (bactofilin family)